MNEQSVEWLLLLLLLFKFQFDDIRLAIGDDDDDNKVSLQKFAVFLPKLYMRCDCDKMYLLFMHVYVCIIL